MEAAEKGLLLLDPRDLEATLSSASPADASVESSELTARELSVRRMVSEGAATKSIAWKLGISERTVKFHVASILSKFGASSRTESVTIGIRRGLMMI